MLQPLLHTIIFLIEMAAAARIAAKFNTYYAEKPGMPLFCPYPRPWVRPLTNMSALIVLTTMVTNAVSLAAQYPDKAHTIAPFGTNY